MIRPVSSLLTALERLLDRALCVAGAALFCQAPEFMQQYLQRLGGHLDEARRQLGRLEDAAAQAGVTVAELGARASAASDPAVARLGAVVKETAGRVDALSAAERALRGASALDRPFVFLRHLDPSIARATWSVFKPAVPTTFEGLAYAIAGMAVVLFAYHFGVKPLARGARRLCAGRPRGSGRPGELTPNTPQP